MFVFQAFGTKEKTELTKKQQTELDRLTKDYLKRLEGVTDQKTIDSITKKYLSDYESMTGGFWKTKPSTAPQELSPASPIGVQSKSLLADKVQVWGKNAKELIFEKNSDVDQVAASRVQDLAGAFINMVSDPLNTAHAETFVAKLQAYQNDKQQAIKPEDKKALEDGERLFAQAFDIFSSNGTLDYEKATAFGNQLRKTQTNVAIIENTAPFINWGSVKPAIDGGSLDGLSKNDLNYVNTRKALLNTDAYKTGYTDYQMYNFVSSAYVGKSAFDDASLIGQISSGKVPAYTGADLISANEDIMENADFLKAKTDFQKEFGSSLIPITSMNLRAQFDFFTHTAPEMKANGLWNAEGISIVNESIVKLDKFLGFSLPSSSITSNKQFNSISEMLSDVKVGDFTTINFNDGTQPVYGVVQQTGTTITIGAMTIDLNNKEQVVVNGVTKQASTIDSYALPLSTNIDNQNVGDIPAMAALPSAKLEGFFFYVMPTLAKHYQREDILSMVGMINESQESISNMWGMATPTYQAVTDVTSARSDLRRYNEKLSELLLASNARKIAIDEIKDEPQYSSFRTVTMRERQFRDLLGRALQNTVVLNPFTNIQLRGLQYYWEPFEGTSVQIGSEQDLSRLFSSLGLQMVRDPYQKTIRIEKYSNQERAAVVQAMTDAINSFGPTEVPLKYFNYSDVSMLTNLTSSKFNGVEMDRTFNFGGSYSAFYGRNTFYNAQLNYSRYDGDVYSGSFSARAYNAPIAGNSKIEESYASGKFSGGKDTPVVLDQVEAYMRYLTPGKDKVAFFVSKDEARGTFSVRAAYRDRENRFQNLTVLENLTDSQVRTLLEHFEINNKWFSPEASVKFESNMPGGAKIGDPLSTEKFSGLMFATNFGKDVGLAVFDDPNPDSKKIALVGENIRAALINDLEVTNEQLRRQGLYREKYDTRQALSSFFNLSEKCGLYAEVFNTKKEGDAKASPDEYAVRFVVDKRFSAAASIDRVTPGSDFDGYSFDGKIYAGGVKAQFTSAIGLANSMRTYAFLPASLIADPDQTIGATSFAINQDNTILQRYAYLNLLYNTKGRLWSQVNGEDNLSRQIGAKYENLFGWAETVFMLAEQKSRIPGFVNNGYGALFSDESRKLIKADWDVQMAGSDGAAYGTWSPMRDYKLYGLNVKNIYFSPKLEMSYGVLGGEYSRIGINGFDKKLLFGAGTRLKYKGTLGNTLALLQATKGEQGSFGAAAGIGYESNEKSKSKTNAYLVGSMRNEGFFSYQNRNVYGLVRKNQFGMYAYYDFETQDLTVAPIVSLPPGLLPQKMEKTQLGGALFYQTLDNRWRVYAQASNIKENLSVSADRQYNVFSLGANFNRLPGTKTPLKLQNMNLQLNYMHNAYGDAPQNFDFKNFNAQLTLYFRPF